MRLARHASALLAAVVCLAAASASGQSQPIQLWNGAAPGSESWAQHERVVTDTPLGTVVFNVVTPTLTAFLPDNSKAAGTGVIIAPGGAFVALAIDLEGNDLARWLQERGIAAFLLKYRLIEKTGEGIPQLDQDEAARYGIADAVQAVKLVRARAAEWSVRGDRVHGLGPGRHRGAWTDRQVRRGARIGRLQTRVSHLQRRWTWLRNAEAGHDERSLDR
jgi:acetyl esterase/lipase